MTNPKKTIKPIMPAKPAAMSEEEKKAAFVRGFSQQFQSIAQGALFNILRADGIKEDPGYTVTMALDVAAEYMLQSGNALKSALDEFTEQSKTQE